MWVKICGVRDVGAARKIAQLQPDAIGLNFFAGSPRVVSREVAGQIVADLPVIIEPVGVFVNETAESIVATCEECGIRTVQFHGDEPPATLVQVQELSSGNLGMIRAHRMGEDGLQSLDKYLDECRRLGVKLRALLIDARVAGAYGGTGKTVDWGKLRMEYNFDACPPMILAGGLTPANVAGAIQASRPWGVDVAGGVESSTGVKDIDAVARFVEQARGATGRA